MKTFTDHYLKSLKETIISCINHPTYYGWDTQIDEKNRRFSIMSGTRHLGFEISATYDMVSDTLTYSIYDRPRGLDGYSQEVVKNFLSDAVPYRIKMEYEAKYRHFEVLHDFFANLGGLNPEETRSYFQERAL